MNARLRPIAFVLSTAALLAACAAGPAGDDAAESRDDAEAAVAGAAAVAETAMVAAWFTDAEVIATPAAAATVEQARALLLAAAEAAIGADVAPPACVTITSDDATFVEATFTGCTGPGGRAALVGTVRGQLGFETRPCGPATCPTAALWSVTADLAYGDGGRLDGAWAVRAPIDPDAARTSAGSFTATAPSGAEVAGQGDASWRADAAGCVTLDADATLTGATAGALAVDGLIACPDACPRAGAIALTTPRAVISFRYGGTASVTVSTAGGRTIEVPLACE